MRIILLLLLLVSSTSIDLAAQVYYQRDSSRITVQAGSVVLPTTVIKPDIIASNNGVPRIEGNQYSKYQMQADDIMKFLNKSQIPTGILYDRVMPLSRLDVFNDDAINDMSSLGHFKQAYTELYNASYQPGAQPKPYVVDNRIRQQALVGKVPIGVIRYRFNYISDLAKQNNQITEDANGYLRDVAGRTSSPYLTRQTLVVAALAEVVEAGNVAMEFKSDLIFNNTGIAISSLRVEPGDANPAVTLTPDANGFTTYYSTPGEKTIKYVVTYANGTQATTYSTLTVKGYASSPTARYVSYPPCNPILERIISALTYQGVDETAPTAGLGHVSYYYAAGKSCLPNQPLTKPVIILDGFDPTDERTGPILFEQYLAYGPEQTENLGKQLRNLGYDVVVLNFPNYDVADLISPNAPRTGNIRGGGADFIQRNAMVLRELIINVNAQLRASGSTEKLVVLGPSMGGLISRYALAFMEQRQESHNTRLYISFDSPHRGANIPLGAQEFLDYYANASGDEAAQLSRDVRINSPAARQMLLHHYQANSVTPAGDPRYRPAFQQELDNLNNGRGFPYQQNDIRKVAILNGSNTGARQLKPDGSAIASCEKAFTFEAKLSRPTRLILLTLGWMVWNPLVLGAAPITLASGQAFYTPIYGASCNVFDGGFLTNRRGVVSVTTPSHTIGLDQAPGGWYDAFGQVANQGTNRPGWLSFGGFFKNFMKNLVETRFYSVVPNHSFIPSLSAIAYKYKSNVNIDWAENVNRDLVCAGETPFNVVYAPTTNQAHVEITAQNAQWCINEITSTPLPTTVSGPGSICTSSSATFTTPAFPGATYTWTASSQLSPQTFTSTSNTFTASGILAGTAWVKVRVTNTCSGNVYEGTTFTNVNLSQATLTTSPALDGFCPYDQFQVWVDVTGGARDYVWSTQGGLNIASGQGSSRVSVNATASFVYGVVNVSFTNACGQTQSISRSYGRGSYCPVQLQYVVYPNPATDFVEIVPDADVADNKAIGSDFEVRVYDNFGQEKLSAKTRKENQVKKLRLAVKHLPVGVYVVDIIHPNGTVKKQLQIMR